MYQHVMFIDHDYPYLQHYSDGNLQYYYLILCQLEYKWMMILRFKKEILIVVRKKSYIYIYDHLHEKPFDDDDDDVWHGTL